VSAVDSPAGYLEIVDEAFASPSEEHARETVQMSLDARLNWLRAENARRDVADRIALTAALGRPVDESDLAAYRRLHDEQVLARRSAVFAAEEALRAIEARA